MSPHGILESRLFVGPNSKPWFRPKFLQVMESPATVKEILAQGEDCQSSERPKPETLSPKP